MRIDLLDHPAAEGASVKVMTTDRLQVQTSDTVKMEIPTRLKVRVTTDLWEVDLLIRVELEPPFAPFIDEVLGIRRAGDRKFPTDLMRALRLGGVVEEVMRQKTWRYEKVGGRWVLQNQPLSPAEVRTVTHPTKPKAVVEAEVEKAAEVYRAALAEGRRDATMAVVEALNLSRPTCARRIQKARQLGLLGPAARTKAGEA